MDEKGNLVINGQRFASYSLDEDTVYEYDTDDDRGELFAEMKKSSRISPDEMWNLSNNFLKFVYPRLKRYRNTCISYPGCEKSLANYKHKLNIMIWAIKHTILDDIPYDDKKNQNKLQRGLKLFTKHMFSFWN